MKVKVEYATLLSEEEYDDNKKYIKNHNEIADADNNWWLRSSKSNTFPTRENEDYSFINLFVDEVNDFVDYCGCDQKELCIRPALYCPTLKSLNLRLGSRVYLNEGTHSYLEFIVINDYLLARFYFGEKYKFNQSKEDGHDYNTSYIKGIVDSWFNSTFKTNEIEIVNDLTENLNSDEEKIILKDFVTKVSEYHKLCISYRGNYDSIDEFFNDNSEGSYNDRDAIFIDDRSNYDIEKVLIKIEKSLIDKKDVNISETFRKVYRIAVNIPNKQYYNNDFIIETVIDSKEKCSQITQLILDALDKYF